MTWEHRGELRADPGIAPGDRNIAPPRRRSIWPAITVVAAAVSFGGVIWFAYQNGRDALHSGPPPLVKADTTPVKVKPDNPGGQEIPFQDSTVYDRLGGRDGQKAPVVEKLLPPTEEPVDRPQPQSADQPPAEPAPPQAAAVPPLQAPPAPAPANGPAPITTQPVTITQSPQIANRTPAPDTSSPTALAPSQGSIVIQPATPPATKPAAPKPAAKQPDAIAALINGPQASQPAPAAGAGGYRVQLSAVRSADAVPAEWARLKHRFPELAPLKSYSNKAEVAGKGTFYRVEAGPLDQANAKSICTHLRAEGLGCIVVKP